MAKREIGRGIPIQAAHGSLLAGAVVLALACSSGGIQGGGSGNAGSGGDGGQGGGGSGGAGGAAGKDGPAGAAPGGGHGDCDPGSTDREGCACDAAGSKRACGSDIGACKKGEQVCGAGSGTVAGGTWGPCEGSAKPGSEKCDDGVDNDCDGRADCADPKCDSFCKGRDAGADAPPPGTEPMCPCGAEICEGMSCAGPAVRLCDPKTGKFGVCKHEPDSCIPGKPTCLLGKCDECSSSLDCPKGQLCNVRGLYYPNTCVVDYPQTSEGKCGPGLLLKTEDCWFGSKNQCTTDADCGAICKENGSCKCHPHGICVKECLVSSDCPAGNYCQTLNARADGKGYDCCGVCTPLPSVFCGKVCGGKP